MKQVIDFVPAHLFSKVKFSVNYRTAGIVGYCWPRPNASTVLSVRSSSTTRRFFSCAVVWEQHRQCSTSSWWENWQSDLCRGVRKLRPTGMFMKTVASRTVLDAVFQSFQTCFVISYDDDRVINAIFNHTFKMYFSSGFVLTWHLLHVLLTLVFSGCPGWM